MSINIAYFVQILVMIINSQVDNRNWKREIERKDMGWLIKNKEDTININLYKVSH